MMTERIPRNVPSRPETPTPLQSKSPDDGPEVAAAASQFSSLMDEKQRKSTAPGDGRSAGESTSESRGKSKDAASESGRKSGDADIEQQGARGKDGAPQKSVGARGGSKDNSGGGSDRQNLSPGDAILQSFSGQQQVDAGVQFQAPAGSAANTPQTLDQIAQQVASQILVSDASAGAPEVRITLNESVLPGTEVRIAETAGRLEVQFLTSSSDSQNVLTQNQGALQERLTARLGQRDVVVSVKSNTREHGDQPDGRSREQRSVIDEYDPDA